MRLISLSVLAAALAAPAAGQVTQLALHYRMDEVMGTTMIDSAGNIDAQYQFAYTLGQTGAALGTGSSVHFDAAGFGRGFFTSAPPIRKPYTLTRYPKTLQNHTKQTHARKHAETEPHHWCDWQGRPNLYRSPDGGRRLVQHQGARSLS